MNNNELRQQREGRRQYILSDVFYLLYRGRGKVNVKRSKSDQLSSIYLNIFTETQESSRKPSNNDMIS